MKWQIRVVVALFSLAMFAGLPWFIWHTLDKYADAEAGTVTLLDLPGKQWLAYSLNESHAHTVENGIVHSTRRTYAQVVDMATGKRVWNQRMKAKSSAGYDFGDGALIAYSDRYLFFMRNALYIFQLQDGKRIRGDAELKALTADAVLESVLWHPQQHELAVLDHEGRGWWINTDSLQVRADDAMSPASLDPTRAIRASGFTLQNRPEERSLRASGVVDEQQHWWLLTSNAGKNSLLQAQPLLGSESLDMRRQLWHGQFDWHNPSSQTFTRLPSPVFIGGSLLLKPQAVGVENMPLPYTDQDSYPQRQPFERVLRELQQRSGPVVEPAAAWSFGPEQLWLVLHQRSLEPNAERLLSALDRQGRVHWTLPLGISELEQIWNDGEGGLLATGPGIGRETDRLLRVNLQQGQGISYGMLDQDRVELKPEPSVP